MPLGAECSDALIAADSNGCSSDLVDVVSSAGDSGGAAEVGVVLARLTLSVHAANGFSCFGGLHDLEWVDFR